MKCIRCNMPIVESGLDRCFCEPSYGKQELDKVFDLAYEVEYLKKRMFERFQFQKIENVISRRPPVFIDRMAVIAAIRKTMKTYTLAVKTIEELPSTESPPEAPLGAWVSEEGMYFYSLDGKQWLPQTEVYPEDFPRRPSTFPNVPEAVIKIRDGNI